MKRHVALVSLSEIRGGILRPLVFLRQQHFVLEIGVHMRAQIAEELVRLRQVFATRSLAFK